ncbi:hypothetical protein ACWCOW_30315 [Streptomyces sp. NPDC001939]
MISGAWFFTGFVMLLLAIWTEDVFNVGPVLDLRRVMLAMFRSCMIRSSRLGFTRRSSRHNSAWMRSTP